jgi:hypothetical protein
MERRLYCFLLLLSELRNEIEEVGGVDMLRGGAGKQARRWLSAFSIPVDNHVER